MSRVGKGMAGCGLLVLGHCGLTLVAASLQGAWFALVPLMAICRSVVGT
jgi:hypothetical protein